MSRRVPRACLPGAAGLALAPALALTLAIAACAPAACSPPRPASAPATEAQEAGESASGDATPSRPPSLVSELLRAIDGVRSEHELPPLAVDPGLEAAAREHSRRMAGGRVPFGHDGFSERVARLPQRPQTAAENVARLSSSSDAVERVLERWTTSRAHRNNLLGDWTHTGLAVASARDGSLYVTQIYARLR